MDKDSHLVSVLADEGKCKVWSHEENQVGNKRDHLGLIWFDFTNASSLCVQNVWSHVENQVAHKGDHLGLGLVLLGSLSFQHSADRFFFALFVKDLMFQKTMTNCTS